MAGEVDTRGNFLPSEFEFLAEDELVTVVPQFRAPTLHFISGDFGPFEPRVQTDVPLWVALQLRKKQKCTVVWPLWLYTEDLVETHRYEKANPLQFAPLPFHYIEIATMLFHVAAEDHPEADKARALLEDVKTLRANKIRVGIDKVLQHSQENAPPAWIQLTNVAAMEVNAIRATFLKAVDKLHEFSKRDPMAVDASQAAKAAVAAAAVPTRRRDVRRRFAARRRHLSDAGTDAGGSVADAAGVGAGDAHGVAAADDEAGWGGSGAAAAGGGGDAVGDGGDGDGWDDAADGDDGDGAGVRKLRRHR